MKKGRKFYASLLLFTAALCPLSGNPDFGTGPAKAAEATVSVPRKLLATAKSGYVKLNWTKTAGADHYFIYRKAGSGSYKKLATVKGTVTSWIDRTAPGGGKFTYAVSAVKNGKVSKRKTATKTLASRPAQPKLSALTYSNNALKLTWQKSANATGYLIYRKVSGGKFVQVTKTPLDASVLSYTDYTVQKNKTYSYTVQAVAAGVRSLFARARNKRIIIATFASNIYRVQQIIDLAVEDGRKVAFSGRSMVNNTAMAQELGYMHIPEGTLIGVEELNQYPPEQVVLITTGSQGEPLSALSRMASCSHRQVRVGPGDFIIISANPIPGNEKSVTKIVNGLLLLGAEVIYESMYDVHVSGHACQEEQKLMLTLTKPKYFLPVHGEYKQLKKHALTAASLGIPTSNILIAENGSNVILSQDEMKLGEPVTAGAVMVDGLGVGDVGNVVLRDRKHLSEDGLVIIVATVDSKTGKVLAGPDLVSRGFVYVRENESLMDGAQSIVENALERCVDEHVRDWNSVKTRVREALSSYIYRRTKRSPMILPILMEV